MSFVDLHYEKNMCYFLLFGWNHGDCEDGENNKGVGWSSCALINIEILIDAQVDQATIIVNLTNV